MSDYDCCEFCYVDSESSEICSIICVYECDCTKVKLRDFEIDDENSIVDPEKYLEAVWMDTSGD